MARPRGDDVKRDVALATFELIAARGVDGMSMRALSEATGLSTGTINYHFGSKHGVLLASIEYGYKQRPHEWDIDDPSANLRALLRRYELTNSAKRTWWHFWLAVASYAQSNTEIAEILENQHAWVIDRFESVVQEGLCRGVFSGTDDPHKAAVRLVNLAHGQAIAQLVGRADLSDATNDFDEMIQVLIQTGFSSIALQK